MTLLLVDEKLALTALVQAAQTGDRQAFGELTERYRQHVFAVVLRRVRNADVAEDLVQEVFLLAMQKLGQLRDPACFAGWLRRIATNLIINRQTRRTPVWGVEPETLEAVSEDTESPLDDLIWEERNDQLRAGLDRLGDVDRRTLQAFYVEGKSLKEMSDEFEAPLGTIKRRLFVARQRLAKEVEELAV